MGRPALASESPPGTYSTRDLTCQCIWGHDTGTANCEILQDWGNLTSKPANQHAPGGKAEALASQLLTPSFSIGGALQWTLLPGLLLRHTELNWNPQRSKEIRVLSLVTSQWYFLLVLLAIVTLEEAHASVFKKQLSSKLTSPSPLFLWQSPSKHTVLCAQNYFRFFPISFPPNSSCLCKQSPRHGEHTSQTQQNHPLARPWLHAWVLKNTECLKSCTVQSHLYEIGN